MPIYVRLLFCPPSWMMQVFTVLEYKQARSTSVEGSNRKFERGRGNTFSPILTSFRWERKTYGKGVNLGWPESRLQSGQLEEFGKFDAEHTFLNFNCIFTSLTVFPTDKYLHHVHSYYKSNY